MLGMKRNTTTLNSCGTLMVLKLQEYIVQNKRLLSLHQVFLKPIN